MVRKASRGQRLDELLARLEARDPDGDPGWLISLVALIRPRRGESATTAVERVVWLADRLEGSPALGQALGAHLLRLFEGRTERHMLSLTGVYLERGFFTGLWRRLTERLLPPVPERGVWFDVLGEVFSHPQDAHWVRAAPAEVWQRIVARAMAGAAAPAPSATAGASTLAAETLAAVHMLSHRLAALGIEPLLLRYYSPHRQQVSPFLAQAVEIDRWIEAAERAGTMRGTDPETLRHIDVLLDQCDEVVGRVRRMAHEQGTSVALTMVLLQATRASRRIRALLAAATAAASQARTEAVAGLLVELVEGECSRHSVRDLVAQTTDLLALQVTENASRTGEHYVTTTRAEYFAMARSAMGAGLIVGFMALVKILIAQLHLPPFWEAFAFGTNYAAGFVLVHLLHFTIATKQPAMTAARIASVAGSLQDRRASLARIAELTAQISRTQMVAIFGNVVLAFPVALAIALLWKAGMGVPVSDPAKSAHLLMDSHPLRSLAIPHAAIAGVCLFLAGVVSGYYDNRCVFDNVPQRLRALAWLNRWFGAPRAAALADYVENNLGAIAGNVAFGFMLGFVGFFGQIFGLPLDIRHVTFSAANAAYGLVGLDFAVAPRTVLAVAAGVALVGLTNLGVSFYLALNTAFKARRLRLATTPLFWRTLGRRFRAAPRSFFLPPRRDDTATPADGA